MVPRVSFASRRAGPPPVVSQRVARTFELPIERSFEKVGCTSSFVDERSVLQGRRLFRADRWPIERRSDRGSRSIVGLFRQRPIRKLSVSTQYGEHAITAC